MENERFDEITKALTSASSRRNTLKALFGGTVASILGVAAFADADAKKKRKKNKKKKKKNKKPNNNVAPSPPPPPVVSPTGPTGGTSHTGDTAHTGDSHDCGLYMWDEKHERCYDDYEHCLYGYDRNSYECYEAPVACPVYPYADCDYGCVYDKHDNASCAEYHECPYDYYYNGYDYSRCEYGCVEDSHYGWVCAEYHACPVDPYADCECDCNYDSSSDEYSCAYCPDKCDYGYDSYGKCNHSRDDYDYGYDYGYYDYYGDYFDKRKRD